MGKKESLLRKKESGYPTSVVERHPAPSVPVSSDDCSNACFNSISGLKERLQYKKHSIRVTFPMELSITKVMDVAKLRRPQ